MPATTDVDRPQEALAVTRRYLKRERPVSALVVITLVAAVLWTYVSTSLLPAVVVGLALAVGVRAPVLQSRGTYRLRTDDDPETVREAFAGPTPPALTFQWGVADAIRTDGDTSTYETSYLFGLRTAETTVQTRTTETADGDCRVELELVVNDQPWSTYAATVTPVAAGTTVDVEYESNVRFGLRRLPQRFVVDRYREDALAAQGYTIVERDTHFGL
jgi:hypothetical protein